MLRRVVLPPRSMLGCGLAIALTFGGLSAARGQTSASDKAAAEALFDQGIELLKAGSYADACDRLESSQRIDPGVGTLLYLGECYEKLGRTASAWATFREAASAADVAGQADRAQIGTERARKLEPRLLRLTLEPDPELGEVDGVEVLMDGRAVSPALWGTPVPVDPGERELEVRAPGYEPFRTTVTCEGEGSSESVRLPMLTPSPGSAGEPQESPSSGTAQAQVTLEDTPSDGSAQRTGGLVLAGLGVVGIGVGSYFGLRALSKENAAEDSCSGNRCSAPEGVDRTNEALSAARISNVAFIAGGAALAGGVVLYLTAPKRQDVARVEVIPTLGGAQLQLGGNF